MGGNAATLPSAGFAFFSADSSVLLDAPFRFLLFVDVSFVATGAVAGAGAAYGDWLSPNPPPPESWP